MESEDTMQPQVSPLEAQSALDTVERNRRRVIDEIDMPRWYWWGLALGWIALGYVTDMGHPWLTSAGTLVFGAVHASAAAHVAGGRNRSSALRVRADVAGRGTPRLVIGSLILLAGVTIAGSLGASADGARHPVTIASIFVAALILLGGPRLLDTVRRKAARQVPAT